MATFGLWYLMWDGHEFRSLMRYHGAVVTNSRYRQRACDYVEVLGKPSQRVYYYDMDAKTLEYLNGVCNYV